MAEQNFHAQAMKSTQNANDSKLVYLGSKITKTQQNVTVIRGVEKPFTRDVRNDGRQQSIILPIA